MSLYFEEKNLLHCRHLVRYGSLSGMFNPFPPRLAKTAPFVTVFYSVKCQTILLIKGELLGGKGLIFLEFSSHIHVATVYTCMVKFAGRFLCCLANK